MVALDTNVLARLLLSDDPVQYKSVKTLFKTAQTFTAPVTVLLELVWLLESRGCTRAEVASALTALLGLPNFKPDSVDAVRDALRHYESGAGFADALHLALCEGRQKFMTFDKAFVRQAKTLGLKPQVVLA